MKKLLIVAGLSLLVAGCKSDTPGHVCLKPGDTVQRVNDRFAGAAKALTQELQERHAHLWAHHLAWNHRIVAAYAGLPDTNVHYQAEQERCERQFERDTERLDRSGEERHDHLQADWDATTEALEHVQR